jgi:uncharacterized 2Fe-2S/4Fe-4S cluster protein (DUF4445 family)
MAGDAVVASSCGGAGTCGKCKAIITAGKVDSEPSSKLSSEEKQNNYILLCRSTIVSDTVEITIPAESRRAALQDSQRERKILASQIKSARSFEHRLPKFDLNPITKNIDLELSPPSLSDNTSDVQRIKKQLKENGVTGSQVDLELIKELALKVREADWNPQAVVMEKKGLNPQIINVKAKKSNIFGFAIDVGTTTIVAELIDLTSGKIHGRASAYNGQIICGDDVISRIVYASKPGGLESIQALVVETMNGLINELLKIHKVEAEDVAFVTAAGNTTMAHLLLGIPPKFIREEPYIPTASYFPIIKAKEIGIKLPYARLYVFPSMASYVGGDIVSGLLATSVPDSEKLTLFIDVGTNGEMVLGNEEWLLACACSAGPAFEGGGVKDGMRATQGAIELVRVNRQTFEPTIMTIGRTNPIGVCGSGLIDGIAELFLSGAIGPNGKYNLELGAKNIVSRDGENQYILCSGEDSETGKDIVMTEIDIDNLMRAKGAVFSGMMTLLDSVSLSVNDIEEVLIAGAFGNYLDIDKTIMIGLLPDLPRDKFTFVGNGSLLGARLALLSGEMMEKAESIASKLTYMDLSSTPKFMDMYMSALFLPHTDLSLFPSVQEKLKSSLLS